MSSLCQKLKKLGFYDLVSGTERVRGKLSLGSAHVIQHGLQGLIVNNREV